jgi:hypothetical protein
MSANRRRTQGLERLYHRIQLMVHRIASFQESARTPTLWLAMDAYWRAHPLRADRLARALAARSRAPEGWKWQIGSNRKSG